VIASAGTELNGTYIKRKVSSGPCKEYQKWENQNKKSLLVYSQQKQAWAILLSNEAKFLQDRPYSQVYESHFFKTAQFIYRSKKSSEPPADPHFRVWDRVHMKTSYEHLKMARLTLDYENRCTKCNTNVS